MLAAQAYRIRSSSARRSKPVMHSAGFTLLELLTVIVVVVILAALLSTALQQARARTNQIACLNHLKQLQMAWIMYVDDNDDRLPLNRSVGTSSPRLIGRRNTESSWVAGNPREDLTTANIENGTLYPYVQSTTIYRCPADDSVTTTGAALRTRSYAMSAYLNGDEAELNPRVKTTYPQIVAQSTEKIFVFIEEHEHSAWAGGFLVVPKDRSSSQWASLPADRHEQGCNLSFADGHIEHWKWSWPKTALMDGIPSINSREVSDVRRLQQAIPGP